MNSFQVGQVRIDRIVEIKTTGGTRFLLPEATRQAVLEIDWLTPHFADPLGRLQMCIHTYVVRTPTQTILIDTGIGNDKPRNIPLWNQRSSSYLEDLAALGVSPENVDRVICTHLHVDHVGWNTMLINGQWVPTFPNARYLFGRVEWEHWSQRDDHGFGPVIEDSVRPIVDAGMADLFEMDDQLCDQIRAEPTPGHSRGHTSLWIESAGQRALISGDLLHHPCQAAHVEWCSTADDDPAQAVESRRRMFAMLAADQVPLLGMHFAPPCTVATHGDAYRMTPVD